MNNKQRRTLAMIFDRPTRGDVRWRDVEGLIEAVGGAIKQGSGSRVRVDLGGDAKVTLHAPHPGPHMAKGAVEQVRALLRKAGIEP